MNAWLIALIAHVMPEPLGEAMAGDLAERFAGDTSGLIRELILSAPAVLSLAFRHNRRETVAAAIAATGAMVAADQLWSFVLTQVPKRASGDRTLTFWLVEAALGVAAALAVVRFRKGRA